MEDMDIYQFLSSRGVNQDVLTVMESEKVISMFDILCAV